MSLLASSSGQRGGFEPAPGKYHNCPLTCPAQVRSLTSVSNNVDPLVVGRTTFISYMVHNGFSRKCAKIGNFEFSKPDIWQYKRKTGGRFYESLSLIFLCAKVKKFNARKFLRISYVRIFSPRGFKKKGWSVLVREVPEFRGTNILIQSKCWGAPKFLSLPRFWGLWNCQHLYEGSKSISKQIIRIKDALWYHNDLLPPLITFHSFIQTY